MSFLPSIDIKFDMTFAKFQAYNSDTLKVEDGTLLTQGIKRGETLRRYIVSTLDSNLKLLGKPSYTITRYYITINASELAGHADTYKAEQIDEYTWEGNI